MIKEGSVFQANGFEGYSVKILKKQGKQYRVCFIGPDYLPIRMIEDVVSEQYIRQRYSINEKK